MKAKCLSVAVLLFAGVAQAAPAQDQDHRGGDHGGWRQAQPHGEHGSGRGGERAHPPGQGAAPRPQGRWQGREAHEGGPRPGWQGAQEGRHEARPDARREWSRPDGNRPDWTRPDKNRPDWTRHGDDRRGDDHRDRGDHDRGGWNRGDHDRGDWNRGEWERRPQGGHGDEHWRGQDRRPDWDRSRPDRDRGHDEGRRWAPHVYPPSYRSPHRYRGREWRPPYGYYERAWRYGEILPRGWYAPDYRIVEWWGYGLPAPPPGLFWVRVGPDALLVDAFSGRIVQVVRYVFW